MNSIGDFCYRLSEKESRKNNVKLLVDQYNKRQDELKLINISIQNKNISGISLLGVALP